MKYSEIDVNIRDVQMVQLELLLEFDRICSKHGIPYQLFAGTLLGAIRHKGFIPWDDDIDVCMLRSDYEKFIDCCKRELGKNYFLQTCFTDPKSIIQFSKIRKNHTVFINKTDCSPETHTGIYIDIFPLDNVKPDTFFGKLQLILFTLSYIITTSSVKERVQLAHNKITIIIRGLLFCFLKLVPKVYVDKTIQKILRMFENEETKYVCHLTNGASKKRINRYLRIKKTFYDIIDWEFEGHMFPVPANYDEVLRRTFGDYMKLPPEEERFPHHGVVRVEL